MSVIPNATSYSESLQKTGNASASAPNTQMGQKEFLMLLTTQMMNQDPTKPMDPTNFVSDLTQMSQLESTTQLNASVMAMTAGFQNLQVMQAASLIGKNVMAEGEKFSHQQGQSSQLRLNTEEPLTDVKVVITNSSGVVKELAWPGNLPKGDTVMNWDGLNSEGGEAASDTYSFVAYGYNADGDIKPIKTVVGTAVTSVGVSGDGSMTLTLATGERINMNAVREIG